jgi:hypothetical protein
MLRACLGPIAFAAATIVAACGDSTAENADEFSIRSAKAVCDNIGDCCVEAGFAFDAARCKAVFQAFVDATLVGRAQAAGAKYDSQAGAECLDWLTAQAQACDLRDELKPCERAFVGMKATGTACRRGLECAPVADSDVECTFGDTGTDLFCTATPHGKLGSVCSSTCTDLIDGSECTGNGGDGANCWTNDGLYCGTSGECQLTSAIGEACSGKGCVDEAFCNQNQVCVADKPDGAACTTNAECTERCLEGVCIRSTSDFISPQFCSGAGVGP